MSAIAASSNANRCNPTNNVQTAGRLKSSPNTIKHGPMKATIPMSSVLKQCSSLWPSDSPVLSPWRAGRADVHSGLRSPGSASNKVKATRNEGTAINCIRRSASLDAIYLQGQWPRENVYVPHLLQVDKATQTEEQDWLVETRTVLQLDEERDRDAPSNDGDKLDKYIRQRMQRSSNPQHPVSNRSQHSPTVNMPVVADHTLHTSSQTNTVCLLPRALPVNIPMKPLSKPTLRNSVEGLNQEIERLVLKSDDVASQRPDKTDKPTPEGHRAPFPDLFRTTRSVNTQTPSVHDLRGSYQSSSSPPSRGGSASPLAMRGQSGGTPPSDTGGVSAKQLRAVTRPAGKSLLAGGSRGSSPDHEFASLCKLGTSPRIFLARGPPDGCERVNMRVDSKHLTLASPMERLMMMPQPVTTCKFQPSQGSAFQRLQPPATDQTGMLSTMPADDCKLVQ